MQFFFSELELVQIRIVKWKIHQKKEHFDVGVTKSRESEEVKKTTETENIIELMLGNNLIGLCFDIFSKLNSKSIANSRLVCQNWKLFIDEQIFGSVKGQLCIQRKITANFLNENFDPKVTSKNLFNGQFRENQTIRLMQVFENHIFIGTLSTTLYNFEYPSLKLLWTTEVYDMIFSRMCVSKRRIFVAIKDPSNVWSIVAISKDNGDILNKYSFYAFEILGFRIFEDDILTVIFNCDRSTCHECLGYMACSIKFIDISGKEFELINEKHEYIPDGWNKELMFTCIENDGKKLISACVEKDCTNPVILAWDFETGNITDILKLKPLLEPFLSNDVELQFIMQYMKVKWPFVFMLENEPFYVNIYDMEAKNILRHIPRTSTKHWFENLNLNSSILMICEQCEDKDDSVDSFSVDIQFWNLAQLLDHRVKIEDVSRRTITSNQSKELYENDILPVIVGSDAVIAVNYSIVKRSFWP